MYRTVLGFTVRFYKSEKGKQTVMLRRSTTQWYVVVFVCVEYLRAGFLIFVYIGVRHGQVLFSLLLEIQFLLFRLLLILCMYL